MTEWLADPLWRALRGLPWPPADDADLPFDDAPHAAEEPPRPVADDPAPPAVAPPETPAPIAPCAEPAPPAESSPHAAVLRWLDGLKSGVDPAGGSRDKA